MTPAPPTSYPIFDTLRLAQGVKATGWDACDTASNHSHDQAQTGIDAWARRWTTPDRPHGLVPVGAAQRSVIVRAAGEDRLPRLHDGHERDPRPIRGP
jgi:hypothetical protein